MNVLELIFKTISSNLLFFSFEEEFSQGRYKRFAELAIFMHYASLDDNSSRYACYEEIRCHLASEMEKVCPDDIFNNYYTAYHIVMPYVFIRSYHRIDELEKSLEIVCDEALFSPELPPHRQMEWDLMLHKLDEKKLLKVQDHSILCRGRLLPFLDRDLVYALTHAVFYLTDFGFSRTAPEGIFIDKILFHTACLIARYYDEQDVDVSMELAISFFALYPFAQDRASADQLFADVMILSERLIYETSFLTLDYPHIAGETGILEEKYHTLFVLGILCTLLKKLDEEEGLPWKITNSVFLSSNIMEHPQENTLDLENLALVKAWRIIDSLKLKSYSKKLYDEYKSVFGRSQYLEDEITFYVGIMKRRNHHGILWNQEFKLLAVHPEQQRVLRAESEDDLMSKMTYEDA